MATNNLSDEQWQEIEQQLFAGRKIAAIKLLREAAGCGLKEAKETIDEHEQQLREAYPEKFKKRGVGCLRVPMLTLVVSTVCVTALLAAAGCASSSDPEAALVYDKQVDVFGVRIIATSDTPEDKILHAAAVLAEYLDNDEDGEPDNPAVVQNLARRNGTVFMFASQAQSREFEFEPFEGRVRADIHLFGDETHPNGAARGVFDASLEEILHLITDSGYGAAYPQVFGRRPGTPLTDAMDKARGGRFQDVPKRYPEGAWYTYYDQTCNYDCQASEYIYWALTSILGGQDFPGRLENIGREWRLNTAEKVKARDPAIYLLLTDPQYIFPTVLPDGNYKGGELTIEPFKGTRRRTARQY